MRKNYDEYIDKADKSSHFIIGLSILGVAILLVAILSLFTDNQKNVTSIGELNFNNSKIEVKDKILEKNSYQGRIKLDEFYMIGTNKDFKLELVDDCNISIDNTVKQGKTEEEIKGGMILKTEYVVDFIIPKKIKYLKFTITKDNIVNTFKIDIRDFRRVKILNR